MVLIKQQEANSEQLQQAIKNFKKSPLERKTLSYLQQQLVKLTELWGEFNKTDNLIRNDSNIPNTHDYYTSKLYEKVSDMFNNVVMKIEEEIKQLKKSTNAQNPHDNNATTSAAATERGYQRKLPVKVQKGISAVKELLRKAGSDFRSVEFLAMQLRTIEQHWTTVQKIHEQLWTAANDDYDIEEFLSQQTTINEEYFNLSTRIKATDTTVNSSTNHQCQREARAAEVKLPTIELPTFDGNFIKWRQFKDLFSELVHRQQLSDVQKLWYLKSSLTGEASRLIQHLSTTSENYTSAWQIINNRYENKRLLVGTTLQRLISQQPVRSDSAASIKQLHDKTYECLLALQALGLNTDSWDPIVIHILWQLLDRQTQLLWEQSLTSPRELPKLTDFMKFLEVRFQSMEAIGPLKKVGHSSNSLIATTKTCIACAQQHSLFQCQEFKKMAVKQRLRLVQNCKNCVNCLQPGHRTNQCTITSNCQRCNKRHNTLLHLESKPTNREESTNKDTEANKPSTSASSLVTATSKRRSAVLLSTVLLNVENVFGHQVQCRAVLDSGSQVHLITQDLAVKLGLQQKNHKLRLQGIGETHQHTSKCVHLQIQSRLTSFTTNIQALIVPTIVEQQPTQTFNVQDWKIPKNIKLADHNFNTSDNVDLLIGAEVFYSILSIGQIKLGNNMPTLQNSQFGWLVGGSCPLSDRNEESLVCGIYVKDNDLSTAIERFWSMEECPSPSTQMTTAEVKCENYFKRTQTRASDGRFIVKLPFVEEENTLGESYGIALQRLRSVEKRLQRDGSLHQAYVKFLREYEQLGHMEAISEAEVGKLHYFLPHHAVLKPESTSTKVRVVFDASARTSNNISLNDILATGPSIQDDVFSQLLRFRSPRYVFTADIEKMYRQIWVHPDDRRFQLILWRENPDHPVKIFKLKTVTYGTSCAPYLAIRCLRQLADEKKNEYPLASEIINRNFYVDDVLAGSNDLSTALHQMRQLRELLSTAGLKLRKWCSNNERLLRHIPEEDREVNLELHKSESVKTMGLIWTPQEDCFSIRVGVEISPRVTKRSALAEISRIFDPLGFIAPVTITAKIFVQDLWKLKLDWDAALPQELHTKWVTFRNEWHQLNQIKVSRHNFGNEEPKCMEVHIFADASEKAYGAVAYIRSVSRTKLVIVRILCAKSKVAPTKQSTLPRLELCAANLAADLMKRIQKDLDIDSKCFHLWSDSTAVLGWINAQSSNYHTFVANRVAAIQRISDSKQWHYIPTKDNPADMITRGLHPSQLINNNLWFYGPKLIHGSSDLWINDKFTGECTLEMRQNKSITLPISAADDDILSNIRHNNSFRRMQRIIAYVIRFSKPKFPEAELAGKANLIIQPQEMQLALHHIVKIVQRSDFSQHIDDLQRRGHVQHNSSISHLSPFLDKIGILRVGGRLESANLSYDAKHPMLLSHKHPMTKLILKELHNDNMHAGVQTMLAISRQKYWIINGKTLARNIVHNCVRCIRYKPKLAEQVMGQLPRDRVTASRPFFISGVDFCGPVYVHYKSRGKRPNKSYVVVFCCFTTKAVHLELVSDLTTDAFIGALKRFTGRRGLCQKLYCDNATNFKGAKNELAEVSSIIHTEEAKTKILTECSRKNIEFCFIPPRAPHFGGLWEAAVKSAKNLLRSSISAASLTYEEMETVLIEAEAILNSRPLTPMSSDPNDMTALTPGHFLIGEPLTTIADAQSPLNRMSHMTRWNLVRQLKNEFWRRWSLEYLNGLQNKYKWNKECGNIKTGTMVILKDENQPPCKWPLGRIERVIPGEDGHVRVVDVRTSNNVSRRPIHKVAPLPVEEDLLNLPEQVNARNEAPKPTTTRKRKAVSSLGTLLVTCLVLQFTSASVTFTPFKGEPGIYFERIGMTNMISSTWSLINFIDLKPFHQEIKLAQNYLDTLTAICSRMSSTVLCQGTIQQLTHQLEMINSRNELLIHNRRSKRGAINAIGNIAGALFGLLDSEYAEKLAETIENLKANDDTLKHYVQNQTMFIDRTLTVIKKNQKEIEREFETLNDLIQTNKKTILSITQAVYQEKLSTSFSMVALQAFMQSTRFQSVQDALLDILTDSQHGKLNPELLTPHDFQTQLVTINHLGTRNARLPLPIDDVSQYFRIMTISHQITKNYLIFSVKIPLIAAKQFELLKLTAIPWTTNNTLFQLNLTTPYVLVDLLRENHVPMSFNEIQKCITSNHDLYFCPQVHPTYNTNSTNNRCVMSILRAAKIDSDCHPIQCEDGTYWKQLHSLNHWLVAVKSNELINAVCDDNPTQMKITGAGILKIGDGCMVRTSTVNIEGHENISSTRHIAYIPACNVSNIRIKPEQMSRPNNYSKASVKLSNDFNILQDELHSLHTISLNKIRPHDVHHYGLGYTMLILVIGCFTWILWMNYKQRRLIKTRNPTPAPRHQNVPTIESDDGDSQIITMTNG